MWHRIPVWFRVFSVGILLVAGMLPRALDAQTSPYTPYQHKALYLFNFAKYTEWPKGAFKDETSAFVLGILGDDPFGSNIDIIRGKTIKGRKLVVKNYRSIEEVKDCHLLFICCSETNNLDHVLRALENTSTLTIAEADGFIEHQGMINLVVEQKTPGSQVVSFDINKAATERANLKLDTQLLKLARRTKS
jgi:YfiR/HmsC-like